MGSSNEKWSNRETRQPEYPYVEEILGLYEQVKIYVENQE